ncbi:MAG: DUF1802 family protein [Acidimicrobiia bacterium]
MTPPSPPRVPSSADGGAPSPAFKEWAAIVHALLAGEQILDVRKGGIHEERRHFGLESTRFWLYPTFVHQQPELVKPAYRHWVETAEPADRAITLAGWADVVGVATLTDPAQLDAIDSRFIWTTEYATSRLEWKRRDRLWVLAMRVHRLTEPITVPYRDDYGGCTSWVTLDGLPADPATVSSEPALSDVAFDARL